MSNTKKLIALLLCFAMLLPTFLACNTEKDPEATTALTAQTTTAPEEDNEDKKVVIDKDGYKSIERYTPMGYDKKYFGVADSKYVINLSYPRDWEFSTDDDGITVISREGKKVGKIISGEATDLSSWKVLKTDEGKNGTLSTAMYLEASKKQARTYRMRFEYTYKDTPAAETTHLITLISDYSEICDFTLNKMLIGQTLKSISSDTVTGSLNDLGDVSSVAIFGNSFIGSSDIGNILSEMFSSNRKHVSVHTDAWPHGTVEDFGADEYTLSNIRLGAYDVVFLCGFYKGIQLNEPLDNIKKACDTSGTKLVVFPAHNENMGTAKSANQRYSDIGIVSWKEELDMLISQGVDKWELCENDSHLHSTPLAGYVGAHMIYRAIYGEMPAVGMSSTISQSYINSILGDYARTANATYIDPSQITYLK